MRLFGVVIGSAVLACFAGLAVTIAFDQLIACRSDQMGCGMGEAYRIFFMPVAAVAVMVVFAVAMLFRNKIRAAGVAAVTLAVLALSTIVLGVGSDLSSGRTTKLDDILELLQVIVPFCAIVATQWFLIRVFLLKRVAAAGQSA